MCSAHWVADWVKNLAESTLRNNKYYSEIAAYTLDEQQVGVGAFGYYITQPQAILRRMKSHTMRSHTHGLVQADGHGLTTTEIFLLLLT